MPQNEQNPYGFDYDPNWRTGGAQQEEEAAPPARVDPGYVPPRESTPEDLSSRYGFDVDPNWRTAQMPEAEDNYGWGITTAFKRGLTRLRALPDLAQGDYEELAGHFGDLEQYRLSEEDQMRMEELENTEGFWGAVGYYLRNPSLVGQVVAESLPMMVAPIAGGVAGGMAGSTVGPAGTVAGAMGGVGVGSYATEYYNSVGEFFQREGIDMTNPEQLQAAFSNPEVMSAAREFARARGIPIAIFDALSMGLAGRVAKPVSGLVKGAQPGAVRTVAGNVAGGTAEMAVQAGAGMAGEAGAQLSAEGEITSYPEIVAEGLGEIVPGMAEAGVNAYLSRRDKAKRAGVVDPTESPLSALDQADEGEQAGWTDIAATDIDPVTGQVVTRTGDPIRDDLDMQIAEAMLDLELTEAEVLMAEQMEAQAAEAEAKPESVGMQEQAIFSEREAQEAAQREAEEAAAREQQVEQIVAQDEAQAEPVPSEMVTPRGIPVEQQPVDIIEGQPAEGMRTTGPEEARYETGGRPAGTPLADALREAGVRRAVQQPPQEPGPLPPPSTPPEIAPEPDLRDTRAAEALEAEVDVEALEEREAIQAESAMPVEEAPVEDIPFEPAEFAPKPAVEWADERLAKREYHEALDRMVGETQAGGGVTLIPDDTVPGYEGPETATQFKGRTPSQNPGWMQSIIAEEGVGRPYVMAAVEKAKEGKRLGAKQKRVVQAILDEFDSPAGQEEFKATLPMPEGATMMPIEQANKLVDPNVPLDKMEEQEGPYLDNLEKQIVEEGFKQPIEITLDEQGNPQKIFDGNHRLRVAQRLGLDEVPIVYVSDQPSNLAVTQVQRLNARLLQDPAMTGTEPFKTNADAKAFTKALVENGWTEQADILGTIYTRDGHSVSVEQNEAGDYVMNVVGAEAGAEAAPAPDADIGVKGDLFSTQANRQMDVEEAAPPPDQPPAGVAKARNDQIIEEIEGSLDTIKNNEFGDLGRARLIKLLRQLQESDDFMAGQLARQVAERIPYQPMRREFLASLEDTTEVRDLRATVERVENNYRHKRPVTPETDQQAYDAINALADLGDRHTYQLLMDLDFQKYDANYIGGTTTDKRFARVKGQRIRVEGVSVAGVSVRGGQRSNTVKFDTLTIDEADQARFDLMVDVYNKTHDRNVPGSVSMDDNILVDVEGNVNFTMPEDRFQQVIDEWANLLEPPPPGSKPIDMRLKGTRTISLQKAQERINQWRQDAIDQGTANPENFNKVILSLFDLTGNWARPYAEAGYDVRTFDIQSGQDVLDFSVQYFMDEWNAFDGKEIYGILAACPCTEFSSSGARWWAEKDLDGRTDAAVQLVDQTIRTIEFFRPKFWVMENPSGRIEKLTDLTNWRTAFQPSNFGDPYTKRTFLWGKFNDDLPTANVKPTEGSKMHLLSPSEDRANLRSETPEGFAYAFFKANNFQDTDPKTRTAAEFPEAAGAVEAAFDAGLTEGQIRSILEDPYGNYEYEQAREDLRQASERAESGIPGLEDLVTNLEQLDPNVPEQMYYVAPRDKGREGGLMKVSFDRMYRGRPWYKVEARGMGEDDMAQVAQIRMRPKDKTGLEWAIYQDGKEVGERWHDFAHAATNIPGWEEGWMSDRIAKSRRKKFIDQSFGWRQGPRFLGTDPTAEVAPEAPRRPRGIGYQLETEIMSKSPAELAKRDKVDLQAIAMRLGLDDTGSKIDIASRIKNFVASTPAAREAQLAGIPTEAEIDAAAAEAAVPTEAQAEAGNYKKGSLTVAGLNFAIENAAGSERNGVTLKDHYGYVKRTEGADGDQVDVFINGKMAEDWTGDVYIVDQMIDNKFDEHKVMFGYKSLMDARRAYKRNFDQDWKGAGPVIKMSLEEFQAWLDEPGANDRPASQSPVTEEGRKNRDAINKDLKYAAGRDFLNGPNDRWIEKVLNPKSKEGYPVHGDVPDTMPIQMAVTELLALQEQRAGAPAAPATPDFGEIQQALQPVEDSLPGAPVTLLHNYRQAPLPVVNAMTDRGLTQVKAVYDPQTGDIYMFADQIKSIDEGVRTALHEKAHQGLRTAFGERLNPLLDDIYTTANETRQDNMRMIEERYNIDTSTVEGRREAAEELLAHMAEHDVSDGIVNRAVAFIRKILRDLGFNIQEYTDNDIRAIIREAQGALSRRADRLAGVTLEEEVVLEETGEVFIVEQNADVALTGINQRIEICKKVRNCL